MRRAFYIQLVYSCEVASTDFWAMYLEHQIQFQCDDLNLKGQLILSDMAIWHDKMFSSVYVFCNKIWKKGNK